MPQQVLLLPRADTPLDILFFIPFYYNEQGTDRSLIGNSLFLTLLLWLL